MYLPMPPCAIPIEAPVKFQKLVSPSAGPTKKLSSGVWVIGPLIMVLTPTSWNNGTSSIQRSSQGIKRTKSPANSSRSKFQSIPLSAQGFEPRVS